jgi:hypothetical protein
MSEVKKGDYVYDTYENKNGIVVEIIDFSRCLVMKGEGDMWHTVNEHLTPITRDEYYQDE